MGPWATTFNRKLRAGQDHLGLHNRTAARLAVILYFSPDEGHTARWLNIRYGLGRNGVQAAYTRLMRDPAAPVAQQDRHGRYQLTTWGREMCFRALERHRNPLRYHAPQP